MKKTLVALATLSAIGSALADVDVSGGIKLYGVLDESVQSQKLTSPISSTYNSTTVGLYSTAATSRLGVRGSRDLGDEVKAELQVEIELDPDTSTLLPAKNRGTFVGLSHPKGGIVRLGTQETTAYEIFGNDVNGRVEYKPQVWRTTASSSTQDRANNSIKYITPQFMGLTGHFMKGYSEYASTYSGGPEFVSAGLKFKQDKLKIEYVVDQLTNTQMGYAFYGQANAGVAKTKPGSSTSTNLITSAAYYYDCSSACTSTTTNTSKTITRNIFSGSYDFGSFSVNYIYADSAKLSLGSLKTSTIGVKVPYEKLTFAVSTGYGDLNSKTSAQVPTQSSSAITKVALAKSGTVKDTTLGITYSFDKSTTAYVYYSTGSFTGGTVDGTNTTMAVGARYNF